MKVLITYCLLLVSFSLYSQKKQYADDVTSPEAISEAILKSISGNKGEKRDWTRFRNLFLPSAQLNAVYHQNDSTWLKVNSIETFIQLAGTWYEENGFKEYSFKIKIEKFGNISHVFQSYGASLADGKEIERGVNSFQLVFLEGRWWIVNLLWDSETKSSKLPKELLK